MTLRKFGEKEKQEVIYKKNTSCFSLLHFGIMRGFLRIRSKVGAALRTVKLPLVDLRSAVGTFIIHIYHSFRSDSITEYLREYGNAIKIM